MLLRRAVYVDAGRLEPGGDLAGDAITEDVARMLPPELLQQRRAATTKTGGGGTAVAASLDSVAMLARYPPRHGVGSKTAHTVLPLNTQAAGWWFWTLVCTHRHYSLMPYFARSQQLEMERTQLLEAVAQAQSMIKQVSATRDNARAEYDALVGGSLCATLYAYYCLPSLRGVIALWKGGLKRSNVVSTLAANRLLLKLRSVWVMLLNAGRIVVMCTVFWLPHTHTHTGVCRDLSAR